MTALDRIRRCAGGARRAQGQGRDHGGGACVAIPAQREAGLSGGGSRSPAQPLSVNEILILPLAGRITAKLAVKLSCIRPVAGPAVRRALALEAQTKKHGGRALVGGGDPWPIAWSGVLSGARAGFWTKARPTVISPTGGQRCRRSTVFSPRSLCGAATKPKATGGAGGRPMRISKCRLSCAEP